MVSDTGCLGKKYPTLAEHGRNAKISNHLLTTNIQVPHRLQLDTISFHLKNAQNKLKSVEERESCSDHGETRQPADWLFIYTTQTQP